MTNELHRLIGEAIQEHLHHTPAWTIDSLTDEIYAALRAALAGSMSDHDELLHWADQRDTPDAWALDQQRRFPHEWCERIGELAAALRAALATPTGDEGVKRCP